VRLTRAEPGPRQGGGEIRKTGLNDSYGRCRWVADVHHNGIEDRPGSGPARRKVRINPAVWYVFDKPDPKRTEFPPLRKWPRSRARIQSTAEPL